MANGGKIFTEKEAVRSLISEASRTSQRTAQKRASIQWVLLLAALTIFILEVAARRLNEIESVVSLRPAPAEILPLDFNSIST
jgi:hypothetical protein